MASSPLEVQLLGSANDNPHFDYDSRHAPIRQTQGKLQTVLFLWNPLSLAYEVATTDSFGGGGGSGTLTDRQKAAIADDAVKSVTYLDAGTDDERVNYVEWTSVSQSVTVRKTMSYSGGPGAYLYNGETWS